MNLLEMIQKEGDRNNTLKKAYEEGRFPSEEVAREIPGEALYKIAADTVEFRAKMDIEILKSSHHLISLIDIYLAECANFERTPEVDLDFLKELRENYSAESIKITESLVGRVNRGYNASW